MINITQIDFLFWQNVHIWSLIQVTYKKFVVHSSAHIKSTQM